MTHLPNEIINKIIMMNAPIRDDYRTPRGELLEQHSFVASFATYHNYTMLDYINNNNYFENRNKWIQQNRFKLNSVIWQINTIAMRIDDTFANFYEYCKYLNFNDNDYDY